LIKRNILPNQAALSKFLAEVEKRAFKHANFATRDSEAALDIVQDAMLRLVDRYAEHPESEWPMLFHRILQNLIRDYYRRTKVRSLWTTLLSAFGKDDDDETDPLDYLPSDPNVEGIGEPFAQLHRSEALSIIEEEVSKLPARQREAFLLRYWEDMDTAETALVMGCSEGSVKTHCSRATHALRKSLQEKGVGL
jgi:RNA polymerase sigma-70 factor, ECF subfamily